MPSRSCVVTPELRGMISMVQPLSVGNALRLFVEPPAGALRWKVLRKGSGSFSGHDDPSAAVVFDGDERVIIDASFLPNDVMAFYRPFYTADGLTWSAGPVASGTPVATYEEQTSDVLVILRERLEAGLQVEVQRGNLVHELGYVQVYAASPSLERDLAFPLVTLHLDSEEPSVRAIGEAVAMDEFDALSDGWSDSEGWLSEVRISIIGWSLNADERIELRRAIRRVVVANLPVFANHGWQQVNLTLQDNDAVGGEYPAPVYQVVGSFSCVAPVVVANGALVPPVRNIIPTISDL